MELSRLYRDRVIFVLFGMLGGYLVLHPYTMLVYALMHTHDYFELHIHFDEIRQQAGTLFKPVMLPMGISFTLFGGAAGFLAAVVVDRKKRLIRVEHEHEKKTIVLETMKELMGTLSHHLLNANMIIGGKVRYIAKIVEKEEILKELGVITEQGRRIDAVIKALRETTELKIADYASGGEVKLIDIDKEIEDHMHWNG